MNLHRVPAYTRIKSESLSWCKTSERNVDVPSFSAGPLSRPDGPAHVAHEVEDHKVPASQGVETGKYLFTAAALNMENSEGTKLCSGDDGVDRITQTREG